MIYLILVSIIWAFSFGLIKGQLSNIEPALVSSIRLLLCVLCFLPMLWLQRSFYPHFKLIALGAVQFGIMYLAYIQSYQYLPGYLVAVFTIFTPLYVVLANSVIKGGVKFKVFIPVLLSLLGAAVIVFKAPEQHNYFMGFLLLQLANISFAIGQVSYRYIAPKNKDASNMFWMFLGAAILACSYTFTKVNVFAVTISASQWWALVYLGVIASGLCFYFWNKGSRQVNTTTLAVMNNGYVPLAVIFAITFFGESADITRLVIGAVLIGISVWLASRSVK